MKQISMSFYFDSNKISYVYIFTTNAYFFFLEMYAFEIKFSLHFTTSKKNMMFNILDLYCISICLEVLLLNACSCKCLLLFLIIILQMPVICYLTYIVEFNRCNYIQNLSNIIIFITSGITIINIYLISFKYSYWVRVVKMHTIKQLYLHYVGPMYMNRIFMSYNTFSWRCYR